MKKAALFLAVVMLSACRFANEQVDMIVHNAVIYAMDEMGSAFEAMAVKDGRIVAVGPEREIMNKYDAPVIIDGRKRAVYPGFIDGHCHFLAYGLMLQDADLVGASSWDEVLTRIQAYAPKRTTEWIVGRGWDQNDWVADHINKNPELKGMEEKEVVVPFPGREDLDRMFPDIPVYLTRIDGHAVLVNGKALELAGIGPDTKISGGEVVVENGRCTGILVDNAISLVDRVIPGHSAGQKIKALQLAQQRCFEVGLTTLSEAGLMWNDIALIDSLQKRGELKMRVYAMLSDVQENYDHYLGKKIDTLNENLSVRSFKFYADGALGSRGACLLTPYEDILKEFGRENYGFLLNAPEYYSRRAQQLYEAGYQMNTHAIGDSANRVMLGIYADVLNGVNDRRWRIEHAQVVDAKDMRVFSECNIIPSVQPSHATSDMPWAWMRLGKQRLARAYAYKELLSQNGMIALGTDFPVEGISPVATFYAAVVRKDARGNPEGGYMKENALSRREALMGMTIWNAVANFEDHYKGSLQVGKVADFVIMDRDLMKCREESIAGATVDLTVINGTVVFAR